jgi:hypothetical protein
MFQRALPRPHWEQPLPRRLRLQWPRSQRIECVNRCSLLTVLEVKPDGPVDMSTEYIYQLMRLCASRKQTENEL